MTERTKAPAEKLSEQMKKHTAKVEEKKEEQNGNFSTVINTGSTLLDLAISGGRVRGGGIPGGILVEIFGPSGSGKSVLLAELAGAVQRQGGDVMFHDPEARLDKAFAGMFGLHLREDNYTTPDKIPEVFSGVRKWQPQGNAKIHGIFADSLAALSTDTEMENDEGDKMGMRRAKEFSEQLRKTCRIITQNNYLMVCSNQVRENLDAGPYGQRYKSPGGEAIGFYSSLRLRTLKPEKINEEQTIAGRKVKRVIGIEVQVEVFKSSVWKPYRVAPVTIIYDYGVDQIRDNLQFIKDYTKYNTYTLGGESLDKSMTGAIKFIEQDNLENELKEEVINLWEEIEEKFKSERKPRR